MTWPGSLSFVGRLAPRLFTALTLLLLGGCASTRPQISPAPFEAFAESIRGLQKQADLVLEFNEGWAYERFLDEAAAGDRRQLEKTTDGLRFQVEETDVFSTMAFEAPLFLTAARFREAAYQFNGAFSAYGQLLTELASHVPLSSDSLEIVASNINADARLAIKLSGARADTSKTPALFSTIAISVVKARLEGAQRQALDRALRANQNGVDSCAAEMAEAMVLAADHLWQEYDQRADGLSRELAGDSTAGPSTTRQRLESFVKLDRQFLDQLAALQTLNRAYVVLPRAHRELSATLEKRPAKLVAIATLHSEVQRLQRLYENLSGDRSPSRTGTGSRVAN